MALASMIDGLSSIDQIAFGVGLGIWIAFFCNGVIRKPLDRHITVLMNGEYQISGYWPLLRTLALVSVVDLLIILLIYYVLREDINIVH